MKLLYANDRPGQHAPSWYAQTSSSPHRPSLAEHAEADVCVIGAGFTGLSAALELCKHGSSVVVLDAHRVGWGASGRNGGQLGTGYNLDQRQLEARLGHKQAQALWKIAEDAKRWINNLCDEHAVDIEYQPGIVHALHRKRFIKGEHEYSRHLSDHYGYDELEPLDAAGIRKRVDTDAYTGGSIDHGAGHVHCLKLARGIAQAAEKSGARIFEMSEVIRLDQRAGHSKKRVVSTNGSVSCKSVVIATNGYLDNLNAKISQRLMPINNFIVVTEPLGELAKALLPHNDAVADSRFVVNYFRRVQGDRLLFGGGENYSYRFPNPVIPTVRKAMMGIFPQLTNTKIDYAWGGTLAITRNRLPFVAQIDPEMYCAGGYSGHGVALATASGVAIAQQITGDSKNFTTLRTIPMKIFPGGKYIRPALLAGAMTFYASIDRF